MTVGEALAEARTRAGLSVGELSERTKIRERVILGIERDDYEACGGNLYVHGYIRVIAGAVGVDAQQLLREFDAAQRGGAVAPPARPEPPARPAPRPSGAGWGAPPEPKAPASRPSSPDSAGRFGRLQRLKRLENAKAAEDARAQAEAMAQVEAIAKAQAEAKAAQAKAAKPSGVALGIVDLTRAASPEAVDLSRAGSADTVVDLMRDVVLSGSGADQAMRETAFDMPALDDEPILPMSSPAPRRVRPEDRADGDDSPRGPRRGPAIMIAVAVIFVLIVAGKMFADGGGSGASTSAAASPSATAASQGSAALPVSLAQAWGPNGTADGDNPVSAGYPVSGGGTPWTTQQYSSAQFGGDKTGTGLLLDMGHVVTVSGVTVDLGSGSGSGLQLQAGNSTGNLTDVASASNVGGTLVLSPGKPVEARYLLVWFTQLPQASDGQYQASVYRISVKGHS